MFEVQPSQNSLVKLTLTGAPLRQVLEQALDGGGPAAQVAGATVRYDPRRPAGRRIRSVEVGRGRKLQANAEYTLAVDDFLASGGDGYALLAGLPFEPGTMLAGEGGV